MKKPVIILIVLLVFAVISVGIGLSSLNRGMAEIKADVVNPVDIAAIADGAHRGQYCKGRWCYSVEVTVQDTKITGVRTTDRKMDANFKLNKRLIEQVILLQKVNVDAVAGATVTSKALLKAIENALQR
jgi:uncharacterized protein with FMN-binding domain